VLSLCALVSGVLPIGPAQAAIEGITGPTFALTARPGYISTGDGQSLLAYGYANGAEMQYPGPTLIVQQGQTVEITLTNLLPAMLPDPVPNVSIVFPGQNNVTAVAIGNVADTAQGNLTLEAKSGGVVKYSFVATQPGTYLYHSGTDVALQVEMGLTGTLIVRPTGPLDPLRHAYGHSGSHFDREYLFLLSEMDISIHRLVELGMRAMVNFSAYHSTSWFINGRNAPDSMSENNVGWLPTQPYGAMALMHPGEKVLLRLVGGGRELHPFHHHGNNTWLIAKDGRMLESAPGVGPDLAVSNFTITMVPGETYDATFEWTGKGLGFDIYGHAPGDAQVASEDPADHGNTLPTVLPEYQGVTIGGFYAGTPHLVTADNVGTLPPGQGGLNPNGAIVFMWHSHTERELTNDDIFPGGAMAMMMIEHPLTPIP
jgi:FtsP/CotA-like multicopper oxidase with cupredoxin domain